MRETAALPELLCREEPPAEALELLVEEAELLLCAEELPLREEVVLRVSLEEFLVREEVVLRDVPEELLSCENEFAGNATMAAATIDAIAMSRMFFISIGFS